LLRSGELPEERIRHGNDVISRNARLQAQLIEDILDVSRIITGKLPMDLNPLELAPVISAATEVVRPTAEAKGIRVETELPAQPMVVAGDSNRLQQVVWNLLSNAIKFTPTGGRVVLSVNERGPHVEIRVTDNGQGISKGFLPFVFDRFRQADSTTTRQHGGLGLGLAIARHLVEIHGGNIRAESDGLEQGATFVVTLPRLGADVSKGGLETDRQKPLDEVARLDGIHVLLVDDDDDTLHLITAALTQGHARVTAVSSAAAAMEAIRIAVPDVLVSDIAMPGEDGYNLLEQVRMLDLDHGRALPAVAITAYAQEEDRQKALAAGFLTYLPKPIELSDLITAVEQAARRP
jgi:CheY-like chemotaxis protein/two-component sensor histidine kinase